MAKVRLAKFKGVPKQTFHLYLKETEWRFNQRGSNKVRLLLRYLRENPLC
jgi:transposase-like protein